MAIWSTRSGMSQAAKSALLLACLNLLSSTSAEDADPVMSGSPSSVRPSKL